jgi:hypothetical protein
MVYHAKLNPILINEDGDTLLFYNKLSVYNYPNKFSPGNYS